MYSKFHLQVRIGMMKDLTSESCEKAVGGHVRVCAHQRACASALVRAWSADRNDQGEERGVGRLPQVTGKPKTSFGETKSYDQRRH